MFMKRIVSLMLCLLLTAALAVPAFAAEETGAPAVQTEAPAQTEPVTQPPETQGETVPPTTVHVHTWQTVTTEATCTADGTKTSTCSGCGETATETIPAAGHSYGGWVNVDTANHKHVCTVCSAEETAAHSWGEGTVNIAPSCTTEGQKTYTCACGAVKTETLPAVDHTWSNWTMTTEGHSRTCSGCAKAESGSHSWGTPKVKEATCKEAGSKAYTCTVCGSSKEEVLPKLTTHTYDHGCDKDCNVCGATRTTEHKYNTAWSRNGTQHWHACTICGHQGELGNHYPGPAATEERAQLCLTCGMTLTAKLNHTHKWESKWSHDETAHYHACPGCDEEKDRKEHTYEDDCDPDCDVCGYTRDAKHRFSQEWESDEEGHWSVCTRCNEKSEVLEHIPDPDAKDTEAQLCKECGWEIAPAKEHVHEFDGPWQSDTQCHWRSCECGETGEPEDHIWDDGQEEEDMIVYTCIRCAEEKLEEAERSGFPWWGILVILIPAVLGGGIALALLLRRGSAAGKYSK